MQPITSTALAIVLLLAAAASGEPLAFKAVMSPKEQICGDLPAPEKHFVLFVRREGKASGTGILDGAQLTEYGMHDIRPGLDGSPRGYLVAKLPSGDQAVIQWEVQATFLPGRDGKPKLLDNGLWRFIGGTGTFSNVRGAGTMHIRPMSATDREFELTGEFVAGKQ